MNDQGPSPVAAAIDIGTNSVKMTVARAAGVGAIEQLDWATTPVLLGKGLELTGRLDDDRIEAALETLRHYAAHARELGATRIVAVATEATRAAENGAAFLDRVRRETDMEVRVIGGQEEADLTFRGLASSTDLSGSVLVADIGGGSTEVILAQDGEIVGSRSLVLGSSRLTDRLVRSDPPTLDEIAVCEEAATEVLDSLGSAFATTPASDMRLLILGGTGEYLHRLIEPDRAIDLPTVRQIQTRLSGKSAAELAEEAGIPEARARVLPAGAAIVAALAVRFKPDRIEIARSGIRTGLLLQLFDAVRDEAAEKEVAVTDSASSSPPRDSRGEQSFCDLMRSLIAERWDVVWKTIPAAIEGSDIEGVHDVRVASRRLRAAMDVGAVCFPAKWYRPLHRSAKEITGALGEVRDRDVLIEALLADRAKAPVTEHPGIDRLIARVERERVDARSGMESYLDAVISGSLRSEVERRFGGKGDTTRSRTRATGGKW